MNPDSTKHIPSEIKLHRKSRLLEVSFKDGQHFQLPCEYLRVFSPAAEVKAQPNPVTGKENVNIERLEAQGNYALRLCFDDGHDSGIYSWTTLRQLGVDQAQNWRNYLDRLAKFGYQRKSVDGTGCRIAIKILYFAILVKALGKESETVMLPIKVRDIQGLLAWLRSQDDIQQKLFKDDAVQVTVNKQFAESFTILESGDEIGIVPKIRIQIPKT